MYDPVNRENLDPQKNMRHVWAQSKTTWLSGHLQAKEKDLGRSQSHWHLDLWSLLFSTTVKSILKATCRCSITEIHASHRGNHISQKTHGKDLRDPRNTYFKVPEPPAAPHTVADTWIQNCPQRCSIHTALVSVPLFRGNGPISTQIHPGLSPGTGQWHLWIFRH